MIKLQIVGNQLVASIMQFQPIKTKKQLKEEEGIPINFVEITILVKDGKRKNAPQYEKKVELVYKKRKADDHNDEYLMSRIRENAKLDKKSIFKIKNIRIIKSMGFGKYEE